ncbi:ABC transporter permease [bacterium]|nr:ABC transporter permease [bacterium]
MTENTIYSPTFFDLSLKQFKKNKLSVAGVCIIAFLFFVAIYAPILANNRPLLIRTTFVDDYEDTFYALLSNLTIYQKNYAENNVIDTQTKRLGYIHSDFSSLKQHLSPQYKKLLDDYKHRFLAQDSLLSINTFAHMLSDFEEQFILKEPPLKRIVKFPAFRNLTSIQIFFMILYPLLFLLFLLKFTLRQKTYHRKIMKHTMLFIFTALIIATIFRIVYPPVFDPTDYKALCSDTDDGCFVIFAPVPYGENENIISEAHSKPTWLIPVKNRTHNYHFFGTDTNGRDVLCRMIWGTRISMSVGFIAVGICLGIGIIIGSLAGYFRGWVDILFSRIVEIVICFPVFFLILTVLAFLRPSIINIMVVIGITGWTGIARLCRGEFLKLVKQDFVIAAKALGAHHLRTIFTHILPNGLGPVLVSVSFGIAGAILTESALSFLGFGVPQPTASWGDLLNNGRNDIQGTWWLTIFPGMAIFITVTAFNLAGEGLRDALDPRLKHE